MRIALCDEYQATRTQIGAITGRNSGNPSWTTPEERKAALSRWVGVIAHEVSKHYEEPGERTGAITGRIDKAIEQNARNPSFRCPECQRQACRN